MGSEIELDLWNEETIVSLIYPLVVGDIVLAEPDEDE